MHALGSNAAIGHLAVRPNEQRWRGNEDSARLLQNSQKETNNSLQTISHAGLWEGGWGDGRHGGEIVPERSEINGFKNTRDLPVQHKMDITAG